MDSHYIQIVSPTFFYIIVLKTKNFKIHLRLPIQKICGGCISSVKHHKNIKF